MNVRQKPSLMLALAKRQSVDVEAVEISWMSRGSAVPMHDSDSLGAVSLEVSFTDFVGPTFIFMAKERSKISLKSLDLWGVAAMGDVFSCLGHVFFMSFQRWIVQ